MIKIIRFVKRKLKVFRYQRSWLILLILMGFVTCLGFEELGQSPLRAQYVPTVTSSHIWQYASFTLENFQTYTSRYGYRTSPVTGEIQFHRGLDMVAPLEELCAKLVGRSSRRFI